MDIADNCQYHLFVLWSESSSLTESGQPFHERKHELTSPRMRSKFFFFWGASPWCMSWRVFGGLGQMVECHSGRIGHPLRALEPKPGGVAMGAMGHPLHHCFRIFFRCFCLFQYVSVPLLPQALRKSICEGPLPCTGSKLIGEGHGVRAGAWDDHRPSVCDVSNHFSWSTFMCTFKNMYWSWIWNTGRGKREHTEKQVLLQQRLQCFVQLKSWQIIEI